MYVVVGGGFDPLHEGHLNYFEGAARFGDLVVVVNSDAWLMRKKGRVFMPQEQRVRLIQHLKMVGTVIPLKAHEDADDTLCCFLREYDENRRTSPFEHQRFVYAKSGDRTTANTPEWETCVELGIPMLFNVCRYNGVHSSDLLKGWECASV
jgi:cytidyltransferase-like protein